jgi:hypothetical protein
MLSEQHIHPEATTAAERISPGPGTRFRTFLPVLLLAIFVVNLPIVFHGILYDRYPDLLTGLVYVSYSLFLAYGASKMCKDLLTTEPVGKIFGMLAVLSILPGMLIGAFFASPYLKATLLTPISLKAPRQRPESLFSGYYKFNSAVVRGALSGSDSQTHSYHVVPLTAVNWRKNRPVNFWLVRRAEDNPFKPSSTRHVRFGGLATRSSTALLNAVENSAQDHGLKTAPHPIFLLEYPEDRKVRHGWGLALSLLLLDGILVGFVALALRRRRNSPPGKAKDRGMEPSNLVRNG